MAMRNPVYVAERRAARLAKRQEDPNFEDLSEYSSEDSQTGRRVIRNKRKMALQAEMKAKKEEEDRIAAAVAAS